MSSVWNQEKHQAQMHRELRGAAVTSGSSLSCRLLREKYHQLHLLLVHACSELLNFLCGDLEHFRMIFLQGCAGGAGLIGLLCHRASRDASLEPKSSLVSRASESPEDASSNSRWRSAFSVESSLIRCRTFESELLRQLLVEQQETLPLDFTVLLQSPHLVFVLLSLLSQLLLQVLHLLLGLRQLPLVALLQLTDPLGL
ncbi:hypothetical protein EYF80_010373 [Liparis tanakae]|uniref:Uncharacterized protein n=1 Tax=Liparis tanakae TaxID=230148 RepID=A0A4Z2IMW5_9TELE|nr:hypothetical protein EYF80_010373 [Liparis tanakae]